MKWCALAALLVTLAGLASFAPARAPAPPPRADPEAVAWLRNSYGEKAETILKAPVKVAFLAHDRDGHEYRMAFSARKIAFVGERWVTLAECWPAVSWMQDNGHRLGMTMTTTANVSLRFDSPVKTVQDMRKARLLLYQHESGDTRMTFRVFPEARLICGGQLEPVPRGP
jgi:hypothetical protein